MPTGNHLNLPKTFNFGGGKVIDIIYAAAGNKLKKTITGSASNYEQDYIGGIEYRSGDSLFAIRLRLFVGVCVCSQATGMLLGGRVD